PNFVRDHREEAGLGAVGRFRLVARLGQSVFGVDAIGHVAPDALHFAAAAPANGNFAPGDPAFVVAGCDFLVAGAGAVGEHGAFALLEHRQRKSGSDEFGLGASGEPAECLIGVGDVAVAVATYDDVILRREKAVGAFL